MCTDGPHAAHRGASHAHTRARHLQRRQRRWHNEAVGVAIRERGLGVLLSDEQRLGRSACLEFGWGQRGVWRDALLGKDTGERGRLERDGRRVRGSAVEQCRTEAGQRGGDGVSQRVARDRVLAENAARSDARCKPWTSVQMLLPPVLIALLLPLSPPLLLMIQAHASSKLYTVGRASHLLSGLLTRRVFFLRCPLRRRRWRRRSAHARRKRQWRRWRELGWGRRRE